MIVVKTILNDRPVKHRVLVPRAHTRRTAPPAPHRAPRRPSVNKLEVSRTFSPGRPRPASFKTPKLLPKNDLTK
jgi:hypothetical protein